jgi:hypothetical protein
VGTTGQLHSRNQHASFERLLSYGNSSQKRFYFWPIKGRVNMFRASAPAFVAPKPHMKIFFLGMFVGEASTLLFNFVIWPAIKPILSNSFIGLDLKPLLDLLS